ncbi:MAG: hypothetical protein ACI9VO_001973, partial [Colwellia sp.]
WSEGHRYFVSIGKKLLISTFLLNLDLEGEHNTNNYLLY